MKKNVFTYLVVLSIGLFSTLNLHAQDTTSVEHKVAKGVKKTGNAISRTAKKVGNKTAEIAAKGKASVVDKVYEGKEGPKGQKIYIDNKSRYYWLDKKGHRRFVAESKLKDKVS